MALEALESLFESNRGGVWFLASHVEPKAIQKLAKARGFAFVHIDGKNITGKDQLMNHVATALRLPKTFGRNWDALEESLVDLEWVDDDGFVIYYDHIDGLLAHPDQFETLVEILRDAVESWKADGTAMIVLLSGTKPPKGVAKLKEG
jgi:RNAse (barnase) inhibitor barstar